MHAAADDIQDIKHRWGRQIAARRRACGETQVQLAARLDRFPQTISRIERGQGAMETFVILANAVGVELLEGDPPSAAT